MYHSSLKMWKIVLVGILFNLLVIECQEEEKYKIKFLKNVYASLSEIPQDYNIVKQNGLGREAYKSQETIVKVQQNDKFAQKQVPDFYAVKSRDPQYQSQKYNYIKGKNILTPKYIQQQPTQQFQQATQKSHQTTQKTNVIIQKSDVTTEKAQPSKEFGSIEVLKEKNLRQAIKDIETEVSTRNFQKLAAYVIFGLILSFAIIKKATKSQPSLPKRNQEKTQLRLRDTVDDDESESSSDSDRQK